MKKRGEEKKKRKNRRGKVWILVWIYDVFVWNLYGSVVWILMVPFLGFSWEFILTLELLKFGLVKP